MLKKYFLLFVFALSIYFTHSLYTLQGLYGDGNGYYSYTNSLFFQHNLDFKPIYNYLSNFPERNYIFSRIFWPRSTNPYLIGTALVWLPSMLFVSSINSLLHLQAGRFDLIYELGPGLTGIFLMIIGLYFLEKYLINCFSKQTVFWTIITIFFASNLLYYTAFEPALSHQPSFFLICFLLWWTYKFKPTRFRYFSLGILFGLLMIVRAVDVILLIPIVLQVKPRPKDWIFIAVGGLISVTPQLINQAVTYGGVFINPYLSGVNGSWTISATHLFNYLFSPKRGLFLWTPIFLISIWGLIKSKSCILIFTILVLWLVSSSWSGYLSAGFGQRFAFSAIPFFAYGLALIFQKLDRKLIIAIFLIFSIWNALLLKNVYLHKDLFIQSNTFSYKEFGSHMVILN